MKKRKQQLAVLASLSCLFVSTIGAAIEEEAEYSRDPLFEKESDLAGKEEQNVDLKTNRIQQSEGNIVENPEDIESDIENEKIDSAFNEGVESRDLSQFPLWGNIENGEIISGGELLPADFEVFMLSAESRWILNGVDRTNQTIEVPNNSTLRITNVGTINGRSVDGLWRFGTRSNINRIDLRSSKNQPQLELRRSNSATSSTVIVDIEYRYQDNDQRVESTVIQASESEMSRTLHYAVGTSNLFAIFTDQVVRSRRRIQVIDNQYVFQRLDPADITDQFNLVETANRRIVIGATTISRAHPYMLMYGYSAPNLNNNSPAIEIHGGKEEKSFVSQYKLIQNVGSITRGEYQLTVSYNPDIHFGMNVEAISDGDGNDLFEYAEVSSEEGELNISVSSEKMKELRSGTIEITLGEATINKSFDQLGDYLEGDYIKLPVTASTNYNPTEVTGIAETWARPWGEAQSQEVSLGDTTAEYAPADFVQNLENKLEGDQPFAVGFVEEREFDTLGETSIGVVIESAISGIQNTIDVPITVIENKGSVFVHHVDKDGKILSNSEELIGIIGEAYETQAKMIKNYHVTKEPDNAKGVFQEKAIDVTYIYDIAPVLPVDPLDPDKEIAPAPPPVLPEGQGLFSIDFVSEFDFGNQVISAQDQTYYAQPQRLLNEDGTVNEYEERPNYVQISDRRSENERNGWELAVTQKEQFKGVENQVLNGASLNLKNQQVITAQGGTAPGLQSVPCTLVPGNRRTLLLAQGSEGKGTWIYRFGDGNTAGESVSLAVPRGANPEATTYSSTLIWELSAVPGN